MGRESGVADWTDTVQRLTPLIRKLCARTHAARVVCEKPVCVHWQWAPHLSDPAIQTLSSELLILRPQKDMEHVPMTYMRTHATHFEVAITLSEAFATMSRTYRTLLKENSAQH